ncbi:MAG: NlpC/P60 family protein [Candidatus Sericytochromatia bacterium]
MASALVTALAAPLHELQAAVGDGVFTDDDPAQVLRAASQAVAELTADGTAGLGQIGAQWSGMAANAAGRTISAALTGAADLATHASGMASRVDAASDAVARTKAQLQRIVDDFEATAQTLEEDLPRSAPALAEATRRALADAAGVVAELEAELDGHAAAVAESGAAATPAMQPPVTSPAGMSSSMLPGAGSVAATPAALMSGLTSAVPASLGDLAEAPMLDSDALGGGVTVRLPDGTTVNAPNKVAADAVRRALTQLGVPYDWGGTTPGVGLDCSGLTQWAYHEAGLDLPRLAQEQDVGVAVSPNALLPGDLAVWDGHVAMVVGNGLMIEAGDPVQLSPIRTTNLNQGFQGFWRPTA